MYHHHTGLIDLVEHVYVVNYLADGVISDTNEPLLSQKEPFVPKVRQACYIFFKTVNCFATHTL